jgi:hypothetical protein
MNEICQDLLRRLSRRHPEVDNKVFLALFDAMLEAWKIDKDLNQLDPYTAARLWDIIEPLERENMEKWLAGILAQRGGKYQDLLKEPMFFSK